MYKVLVAEDKSLVRKINKKTHGFKTQFGQK